jgi:hypothetical protein
VVAGLSPGVAAAAAVVVAKLTLVSLVLLPRAERGESLVGLHAVDWPLDSRDKMQHQQRRCRATANLHRWQISSIEAIPMRAGLAGQQPPPRPRPASAPLGVAAPPALSTRERDTAWSEGLDLQECPSKVRLPPTISRRHTSISRPWRSGHARRLSPCAILPFVLLLGHRFVSSDTSTQTSLY